MKNYKQNPAHTAVDLSIPKAPVSKYMARDLITFKRDTPIEEVIDILLSRRISGAPVLDDRGGVVGLIDDKDCLNLIVDRAYHNQPMTSGTVKDYMTNVMKTINEGADIMDAANIFLTEKYKRLLVVNEDGQLMGQISRRDILRAISEMKSTTW